MLAQIIKKNFFVITSENFRDINNAFYGYAITADHIYFSGDDFPYDKYANGVFVKIDRSGTALTIRQDYFCGFGLYIFREAAFWAVSNSLFVLIEYLKSKHRLTLNEAYLHLYLIHPLTSPTITQTVINEINEITAGQYLSIDMQTGVLETRWESYDLFTIPFFSEETIRTLDDWHDKYHSLIMLLANNAVNVYVELSGGMDSRMDFAVVKGLDFNKANVCLNSMNDAGHREDFAIASKIASIYNIPINKWPKHSNTTLKIEEAISCDLLTKLCMHCDIFAPCGINNVPCFAYTGFGGESIRQYLPLDKQSYIAKFGSFKIFDGIDLTVKSKALLENILDYLDANYDYPLPAGRKIYFYGRQKKHFLRSMAASLLSCRYIIAPLLDLSLYRINTAESKICDNNYLPALIYDRYLPELKDIPFYIPREIAKDVWDNTHELNLKYPRHESTNKTRYNNISIMQSIFIRKCDDSRKMSQHEYLLNLFKSNDVRNVINNLLGKDIYQYAKQFYASDPNIGHHLLNKLLNIYFANNLLSSKDLFPSVQEEPNFSWGTFANILERMNTCIIVISLIGSQKHKMVINDYDDPNLEYDYPSWYKTENSNPLLITTHCKNVRVNVTANAKGRCIIQIRPPYLPDNEGKALPLKLDFLDIKIAYPGNAQINPMGNVFGRDFNHPLSCTADLDANDVLEISFSWQISDHSRADLLAVISGLYDRLPERVQI